MKNNSSAFVICVPKTVYGFSGNRIRDSKTVRFSLKTVFYDFFKNRIREKPKTVVCPTTFNFGIEKTTKTQFNIKNRITVMIEPYHRPMSCRVAVYGITSDESI